MATLDQIAQALKGADAAGDTQAAQQLAQAYKQAQGAQQAPATGLSQYTPLERQLITSGQKTSAQIDALHKGIALQNEARAFNPNSDMSFGQQVMASVGQTAYNTARGIGQLTGQESQADIDAAKQQDAPLLNTAGSTAGQVLGYGAQALLPGGALKGAGVAADTLGAVRIADALGDAGNALLIPKSLGTAAAVGGAQAALQPVATGDSRFLNTAVGAGAGVLGSGVPRIAGALAAPVSDATQALAQKAKALGIDVTPAQLSDSTFVKTLRSVVGKFPFSGSDANKVSQAGQYNSAIAKVLGETLDPENPVFTSQVMANAKARIGDMFDRAASHGVPVDAQFGRTLTGIRDEASQVLTPEQMAPLQKQISNIFDKVGDNSQISGQSYQALTSHGSPLSRALSGTDPNVKYYVGQIKGALDDAMQRNGNPIQQAILSQARPQYKVLKTIEPLVNKSPKGYISPALLMQKVAQKTPSMAYGGGGDLADIGRIGQVFLKDSIPDSGTAQRIGIQNFLMGMTRPAEVGGAALAGHLAGFSAPVTGAALVGGIGAARTIRAILDNPTVAKAMLARNPEARAALVHVLESAQPAARTAQLTYEGNR